MASAQPSPTSSVAPQALFQYDEDGVSTPQMSRTRGRLAELESSAGASLSPKQTHLLQRLHGLMHSFKELKHRVREMRSPTQGGVVRIVL